MNTYEKRETILKVENASLTLGGTKILKDINVEIKNIVRPGMTQGQIIGFLGPSGMGKTKFFEMLSGIIPIEAEMETLTEEELKTKDSRATGKISIGLNLESVKLGNVGVIQQNYPLFEHRTIYNNLNIAAQIKYKNKKERADKIDDILKRFDMEKRKNYYPLQLSGGQRQRVAIAQQILCSNNFLLMDEPFSGLDPLMVEVVSNIIIEAANMHELNKIVVVSHDIVSTAAISDTLWVLGRDRNEKGEVIPGAKIKHEYDLIQKGLAWKPEIETTSEFHHLCDELRCLFPTL